MSTWDDDDDDETPDEPPAAAELPEPARKAMRRMEKQLKQQGELLARYQEQERRSVVASVLKEKGVPEKVAALVPSSVDSTPEAITAWLGEWDDVFGGGTVTAPEASGSTVDQSTESAISQINGFGQTPSGTGAPAPSTPQGVEAAIRATTNRDELNALLAQLTGRG